MKHTYIGSSFDDFLAEDGILGETEEIALKRVFVWKKLKDGDLEKIENSLKNTDLEFEDFDLIQKHIVCGYFDNLEDISYKIEQGLHENDYLTFMLKTIRGREYYLLMRKWSFEELEQMEF
jgi:predicted TPR repeat methyltransferase